MGWSLKKPLGGSNSFVRRTISTPAAALVGGAALGPTGSVLGAALNDVNRNFQNKYDELTKAGQGLDESQFSELDALARTEEERRKALGLRQQQQILDFATNEESRAKDFRTQLAQSLSDNGQQFFNRMAPGILEDLNRRGLFTSQTARDQEYSSALKDIELANQNVLSNFDTNTFNTISDLRGTALSALLGGDQSALDSALELRKAKISKQFDSAEAERERNYAEMLARRNSRDNLIASILGLGGSLGSSALLGGV